MVHTSHAQSLQGLSPLLIRHRNVFFFSNWIYIKTATVWFVSRLQAILLLGSRASAKCDWVDIERGAQANGNEAERKWAEKKKRGRWLCSLPLGLISARSRFALDFRSLALTALALLSERGTACSLCSTLLACEQAHVHSRIRQASEAALQQTNCIERNPFYCRMWQETSFTASTWWSRSYSTLVALANQSPNSG